MSPILNSKLAIRSATFDLTILPNSLGVKLRHRLKRRVLLYNSLPLILINKWVLLSVETVLFLTLFSP